MQALLSKKGLWKSWTIWINLHTLSSCKTRPKIFFLSIFLYDTRPIWIFVRIGWSRKWEKEYKITPSNSATNKTCNYIAVFCIWWNSAFVAVCHICFHILSYSSAVLICCYENNSHRLFPYLISTSKRDKNFFCCSLL